MHLIFLLFIFLITPQSVPTTENPNVEVTIEGIRSEEGFIQIGTFRDNESFEESNAERELVFSKKGLKGGMLKVTLELKPGRCGISVLDDENGDGKMEYNFIGIPREGFGFSDYYHTGFSRPVLDDFDLDIPASGMIKVRVKMRYM